MGLVQDIAQSQLSLGQLEARGAENLGAIRAQGIQQLGNIEAQRAQQQGQLVSNLGQNLTGQVVQGIQQKQASDLAKKTAAIVGAIPRDENGLANTQEIDQRLRAAGVPADQIAKAIEPLDKMNQVGISYLNAKREQTKQAEAERVAHQAKLGQSLEEMFPGDTPIPPEQFLAATEFGRGLQMVTPQEAQGVHDALEQGMNPRAIIKALKAQGQKPEENYTLGPDQVRVQGGTNQVVARGTPKVETPKNEVELALAAQGTGPEAEAARSALAALRPPKDVKGITSEVGLAQDAATLGTPGETPTAKQSAAALRILKPQGSGGLTPDASVKRQDAQTVAKGIKQFVETGEGLSPEILLSSRTTEQGMALNAELQRMGVDTAKLTREWTATKGAIRALNSTQQIRLAEVINKASSSLDKLDELNQEWSKNAPRWGIKALNAGTLKAAQNGAFGPEAASVAQRLDGQIADTTSELGQGIMGGNTPTDHAFQLAAKNLSSNWTQKVLDDSIKQVRYNLNLAQNARNELLQQFGVQSTQVQTPAAGASIQAPVSAAPTAPAAPVNPFRR